MFRYTHLSETINGEQRFESSMQAQMNSIQRDLRTLHEEIRTIQSATKAVATNQHRANANYQSRIVHENQRRNSSKGLSCSAIFFCIMFVIACVVFTYYYNTSSSKPNIS